MDRSSEHLPEGGAPDEAAAQAAARFRVLLEPVAPPPDLRRRVAQSCAQVEKDSPHTGLTYLKTGVAAAVLLCGSAWLLLHLLAVPAQLGEGQDAERLRHSVTGGDGEGTEADQERDKEIAELLKRLESEHFGDRKAAADGLVARGASARDRVARRLAEAQAASAGEQVVADLKAVLGRIDADHRALLLSDAQKDLDRAVDEAPAHYLEPDAALLARLQEKASFNCTSVPFRKWLADVSEAYNIPILFDPRSAEGMPNAYAEGEIHLKCKDWDLWRCLRGSVGMWNRDVVVRGKTVIVTMPERARRLRMKKMKMELPGAWSLDETNRMARIMAVWPVKKNFRYDGRLNFVQAEVLGAKAVVAGTIEVSAEDWGRPFLERLAESLQPGAAELETNFEEWRDNKISRLKEIDSLLMAEVNGPIPEQRWADVLNKLAAAAGTTIIAECLEWKYSERAGSVIAKSNAPEGHEQYMFTGEADQLRFLLAQGSGMAKPAFAVPQAKAKVRDVLLDACERLSMAVSMGPNWELWVVVPKAHFTGMETQAFVLDVRKALAAGVPEAALGDRLAGLLRQAGLKPHGVILRGRWFAAPDPWTQQRAVQLVQDAAKAGRLPEQDPPAPWFFATFPKP